MADTELEALTALTAANTVDTDVVYIVDVSAGTAHKMEVSELKTLVKYEQTKVVTATQSNTTVTGAAITDLTVTGLVAGTYLIRVWLVWQSTAVGTGAGFWVNMTGTTTLNVGHVYTTTSGGAATTGVADQQTATGVFQMVESRAWRANNSDPHSYGGVDTANADQFAMLEAVVTTTTTGDLQIMFDSETAGTGVSIRVGTVLEYKKVA
jgi:hypothetical protein